MPRATHMIQTIINDTYYEAIQARKPKIKSMEQRIGMQPPTDEPWSPMEVRNLIDKISEDINAYLASMALINLTKGE